MIIKTMHFGEMKIDEKSILHFEEGLPGFEDIKDYVIITEAEKDTSFKWLQAVENYHPAFAIISPFEINEGYEIDIDEATIELLEIKGPADIAIYSVVVIPEDITKMTANLKAPIVINVSNNKGRQMIMDNSPYQTKHYILEEILKNAPQPEEAK